MRLFFKQLSFLALILVIVVCLFTVCRFLFYFYNYDLFGDYHTEQTMSALVNGIVYDVLTVLFVNSVFIFLYLWPARIYNSIFHNALIKTVFFLSNSIAIILNLVDFGVYKQFNHRLNAYSFKQDLYGFFEQFDIVDIEELGKNHLSLIVYASIFIVAIWFTRRLVGRYYYERKKYRKLRGWFSFGLFVALLTILIWSGFNRGEWLEDLYLKSNRKLSSLTLNNPYFLWHTYNSDKKSWHIDWHLNDPKQNNKCTNRKSYTFQDINIILLNSDVDLTRYERKYNYHLRGFNNSTNGLDKLLDEILLSYPPVFETGIYKTPYSLNKLESLPEFLQKLSYKCDLKMDEGNVDYIKNFYGFYSETDSVSGVGKTFRLVFQNAEDQNSIIDSVLNLSNKSYLNLFAILNRDSINKKNRFLGEKLFIASSEKLPFVDSLNYFAHFLDIKPTIECLLGRKSESVSYGKNLFDESDFIYQSNDNNDGLVLVDSLLLVIKDSETVELLKRKGNEFDSYDFKDSLAVERIVLENKYHSLISDYKKRLMTDKMMID